MISMISPAIAFDSQLFRNFSRIEILIWRERIRVAPHSPATHALLTCGGSPFDDFEESEWLQG